MTRGWLALALLVVLGALAGVVGGAWRLVARDREEAVARYASERRRQVVEAAREIGGQLDEAGRALRVAGGLLQRTNGAALPLRELAALQRGVGSFRVLALYNERGGQLARLGDAGGPAAGQAAAAGQPRDEGARGDATGDATDGATGGATDGATDGAIDDALVTAALDGAARDVLGMTPQPPRVDEVEGPDEGRGSRVAGYPLAVPGGRGWARLFATTVELSPDGSGAPPPRRAIVALLVMPRLLDTLHRLAGDGTTRSFLVGGPGEPTTAGDAASARAIGEAEDRPAAHEDLAALLRRVRQAGAAGAGGEVVAISPSAAASLGLAPEPAVASLAAVHGDGARGWAVATVASLAPLGEHDRALVRRVGVAAGAVLLVLLLFGALVLVSSRRAVALRERLRHADALAHLHDKTDKVLDHVPTAVLVLSDDGRVTSANRAARDRLPERALGQPLAAAFPEAPTAVTARLGQLVDEARQGGTVRSLHGERLALYGEEGQYSVHAVPLEPRFPEARALLVVEDVGKVHTLASQLLRAEKLATLGALSAGIAEEIGTPLGVVRGRAEYILGKLGPGHPQAPGLAAIVDQVDHVAATVRRLLDFARVRPAAVRTVEVTPILHAVGELLRYPAERRLVTLHTDVATDVATNVATNVPAVASTLAVLADPDQLQQLLVHLCLNALDACPEGGHVTLRASAHPASTRSAPDSTPTWPHVRIEVEDDGPGIPEELRQRIFDPFFTTKERAPGMGLTLAAEIARNHGAQIDLEEPPTHGTRVVLRWPTAAPVPPAAAP